MVMDINEITFDNLPKAIAYLIQEMGDIKLLLQQRELQAVQMKKNPINITEACKIIGKAKPTVYGLVQKKMIPCYKTGKMLYFFEDELLDWILKSKRKTLYEIDLEAKAYLKKR